MEGPSSDEPDIQELFTDVVETVDILYDLAPALLDPAPHDRIVDPLSKKIPPTDKGFDLRHARDKFPGASKELADRLGTANWFRRGRLNYMREKQNIKLRQIEEARIRDQCSVAKSRQTTSTAISTVPSTVLPSIFDHSKSDSESNASATSYAVTVTKGPDGPIRVPRPPEEYYQELPFECPYCYISLANIRTMKSWK
jgi:hypothetical protein